MHMLGETYLFSFQTYFFSSPPFSSITDMVLSHSSFSSFKCKFLSLQCIICFALLLCYLLPFFPFVYWSFKRWFIQEKGKSPLLMFIYAPYTVSQCLLSPGLLMFPPLISAMKHSSVATEDRRVGVWSHRQRSASKRKRESQEKKLWARLSAKVFVFRPSFNLEWAYCLFANQGCNSQFQLFCWRGALSVFYHGTRPAM